MTVPGLDRGIAILRLFRRDRHHLSPMQIAAELDIPRSTVHRLLAGLTDLGLLRRTGDGRYGLDAGVLTLGFEYLASNDIVALAGPLLEALRNETNWSTHLAIRQGRNIVYLSRYASRAAVTRNVAIGTSLPAHATMMGRVLLSQLEPTELHDLYGNGELHAAEPRGPASVGDLRRMIDADRTRGFAAATGFYEPGVRAAAAGVRDMSLSIVAAINATAPGNDEGELATVAAAVRATADRISRLLGAPERLPQVDFTNTGEEQWV